MQQKKTFCRICEAQCGLIVSTQNDQVVKIEPNNAHVSSTGYACIKGLKMGDFVHSPDRLQTPLKKIDNQFAAISWEQALNEIGAKLSAIHKEHGGAAIAAYMGNPIGFSLWPSMMMTYFLKAFEADKLFTPGTQDCASKFAGGERLYGSAQDQTFPDIDNTELFIAVGTNPLISKMSFISLPHPMDRIKAIEDRGGKVVWINPRNTESARRTGEHIAIRPDTDVFFMLGFLNEVIRQGGVQHEHVANHMNGYDELAKVAQPWTAERVAKATHIPAEKLVQLVSAYLAADGAAIYHSTGVNQGRFGLMVYWLQEAINAVTGNLDKRGGVLAGKSIFPRLPPQESIPTSRINNIPYVNSLIPAGILADEILTPGPGKVRAMVNMSGNPLLTCAGSNRLGEAFEALELFVCMDIVRNETAQYADYILPTLHSLERADVPFYFFTMMGLMPTRSFTYTEPVIPAPGEARDEGLIFRQMCRAAGKPLSGSRMIQWLCNLSELTSKVPYLGKLTSLDRLFFSLLMRTGKIGGVTKNAKFEDGRLLEPNQPGDYLGKRVQTPSGKVELAPADLVARSATLEAVYAEELELRSSLKMIQKRERYTHNSWAHNVAAFVKGDRSTNYLYIHPDDAEARGLSDGDLARVHANDNAIEVPVKLDEHIMLGTVSVPHGWGHQSADGLQIANKTTGVNVNIIMPDGPNSIEPTSGMSHMNGVVVDIARA